MTWNVAGRSRSDALAWREPRWAWVLLTALLAVAAPAVLLEDTLGALIALSAGAALAGAALALWRMRAAPPASRWGVVLRFLAVGAVVAIVMALIIVPFALLIAATDGQDEWAWENVGIMFLGAAVYGAPLGLIIGLPWAGWAGLVAAFALFERPRR
jgi:hypothetical protein